jgi:integrase
LGTLYKRAGSKKWMMAVFVAGKQICKSTKTNNKRRALYMLQKWETNLFEDRCNLPTSTPPYFDEWADEFLKEVRHPNTRRRYASSVGKLRGKFAGVLLSNISAARIEAYKQSRLTEGVEPATINHDLRVLKKALRRAESRNLIARSPFKGVEFLAQREPHEPHIVTFEEEEKILAVATPLIRALVVLILETGMRSHREALALRWDAINFIDNFIRVRESKTRAGIRNVPMSMRCKAALLRWRTTIGPEFSPFVFPNLRTPARPMKDVRHSWAKTLEDAGLEYFWIYNLRHTFASRMSAAGVSDLFVGQMIGHKTPGILQKYSRAIDEYRRDAVRKLENMRAEHAQRDPISATIN